MHSPHEATGKPFYSIKRIGAIADVPKESVAPDCASTMFLEASSAEITDVGGICVSWHTYPNLAALALMAVHILPEMVSVNSCHMSAASTGATGF